MINQTVSENLCNFTCPACHSIGSTFMKIFWRKCVPSKQGNNDVLKKALFPVCERWKTLQNKAVVVSTYTKTKDSHPALSVFYEQLPLAQRSNAAVLSPFKNKKTLLYAHSPLLCSVSHSKVRSTTLTHHKFTLSCVEYADILSLYLKFLDWIF